MHLLLISPCDLLINVTLNISIINVIFAAAFFIQTFILTIFLASNYLIFDAGKLYFAASKMFHQFFFEFAWNGSSVLTGYNDE